MSRESQYYRDRDSAAVVEETRGVPLRIIGIFFCVCYVVSAGQSLFRCGKPLFVEANPDSPLADCDGNPNKQFLSDVLTVYKITLAAMRYHMVTTNHVAEVYMTSLFLTSSDVLLLLAWIRFGKVPLLYMSILTCVVVYEIYTFVFIRKAHVARMKMKKSA